jgi:hypothetical protein
MKLCSVQATPDLKCIKGCKNVKISWSMSELPLDHLLIQLCSWLIRSTSCKISVLLQMKEEQLRLEESEADMRKRLKSQREHHKEWEENRESRVGTWRDFAKGNKSKKVVSQHDMRL